MPMTCAICAKTFFKRTSNHKYCASCAIKVDRAHKKRYDLIKYQAKLITKNCRFCENDFDGTSNQVFCNEECKKKMKMKLMSDKWLIREPKKVSRNGFQFGKL